MDSTVLIELGDDWSVVDDPAARRRRPASRLLRAGALGLLVLLLVGAAAAPRPPLAELAAIPTSGEITVEPGPDTVFVGQQSPGQLAVSRYAVPGGRRLWRTGLTDTPESLRYVPVAGVLAVSTFEPVPGTSRLTVLDARTGRRLWASSGYPLWLWPPPDQGRRADLAVLLAGDDTGPRRLRVVRLRTGRTVWSRPLGTGAQVQLADWAATGRPDLVVIGADGAATVLAGTSGAVLGALRLPAAADVRPSSGDPDEGAGQATVNVVGGQLIVARSVPSAVGSPSGAGSGDAGKVGAGETRARRAGSDGAGWADAPPAAPPVTELTAYTLPGLTRGWQRTGEFSGFPDDCGQVLCLGEPDRLLGLDRGTGAVRWSADRWQGASAIGDGRLLGYQLGEGEHTTGVLDARTGRLLVDLGDWSPLPSFATARLLTRPDPVDYRYTWFAQLGGHPATGGAAGGGASVQPVARVAGIGLDGCQPDRHLLVCTTLDDRVTVWRYPA